ncbi:AAA family ATPase [Dongia deserti]|uniref:AAA family ATPase n=1 Tax=Dongia deserti TaxID=2268030 RepID=UPI000E6473DA|nr:AAA family ATPase [Dongia deserti]
MKQAIDQAPADSVVVPLNQAELRERVRALMTKEEISQAQLAREVGLSTSVISQWLSDSYRGDSNKVAGALVKWLKSRDENARINAVLPSAPSWVEAPTAKRIYDALAYAQHVGDIAVIYGGAGLSKTTTIRRYREKNVNVWVVTATPATAGVALVLEEIAIALGFRDYPLHPAKLQRAILRHIQDTGGLLVIDEAQHLTKQALEAARSLHDATGIGLVLSGNAAVFNNLYRGGNNGFAQLFSRVGKRLALVRPVAGDVHAMAGAFKIKGTAELRELEAISRRPGALRMVVKVLRLAAVLAGGAAVTVQHIKAAWEELQGEAIDQQEAAS